METNDIFNNLLGGKHVFFQKSHGNTIHIGDIVYDKNTKQLTVQCPKKDCRTPADIETREQTSTYVAFICKKCGHRFFEHDEIAQNISSYVHLNPSEEREFVRLLEAVNHDLQIGDAEKAYERCNRNKEKYGMTPQIYEWGALTLFLTKDVEYWIKKTPNAIITYLEKSKQLDAKSLTFSKIASSIATRYFQGLSVYIEEVRNNKPLFPTFDAKEISKEDQQQIMAVYQEEYKKYRKNIFIYLRELKTCFNIYPNTDFIKFCLNELYGYNGMAWYHRSFASLFFKPQDDSTGRIKILKGYVWDFHSLFGNCDVFFETNELKPTELSVEMEALLKKHDPSFPLPEIRIGNFEDVPLSSKASLNIFVIVVTTIFVSILAILWVLKYFMIVILIAILIALFLHFKDRDGHIPDDLRRLNNKHTGRP